MLDKLIIVGIGQLSRQLISYNQRYNLFDILCFADENEEVIGSEFCNHEVVSMDTAFQKVALLKTKGERVKFLVAIGYTKCSTNRERLCNILKKAGCELANFISPNTTCWDGAIVGDNIIVFDDVFIGWGCTVESGNIIYEGSVLSHGVKLCPYSFISNAVVIGGNAVIKSNSFIGLNSTIKSSIIIERYNIVGCGSNIIKSTSEYQLSYGNPGRSRTLNTMDVEI